MIELTLNSKPIWINPRYIVEVHESRLSGSFIVVTAGYVGENYTVEETPEEIIKLIEGVNV